MLWEEENTRHWLHPVPSLPALRARNLIFRCFHLTRNLIQAGERGGSVGSATSLKLVKCGASDFRVKFEEILI
jgi:hypothetical protein